MLGGGLVGGVVGWVVVGLVGPIRAVTTGAVSMSTAATRTVTSTLRIPSRSLCQRGPSRVAQPPPTGGEQMNEPSDHAQVEHPDLDDALDEDNNGPVFETTFEGLEEDEGEVEPDG
jgi:hypothetical protein